MHPITHIVVHYSATYPDQNLTAADIDRMHRKRGFRCIGYHWFIRRDGTVEQGRPENEVGAHVGGQNTGKLGVCWEGGIEHATGVNVGVDNRTPAQTKALTAKIHEMLGRYPGVTVCGHRDLAATQCPGFDVAAWWAGHAKPVVTPGVCEDQSHIVERGDTWWGIAREHGLTVNQLLSANKASANDILEIGRVVTLPSGGRG